MVLHGTSLGSAEKAYGRSCGEARHRPCGIRAAHVPRRGVPRANAPKRRNDAYTSKGNAGSADFGEGWVRCRAQRAIPLSSLSCGRQPATHPLKSAESVFVLSFRFDAVALEALLRPRWGTGGIWYTAGEMRQGRQSVFHGRTAEALDEIHDALAAAFAQTPAPIMDLVAAQTKDPYRILVGTILSARTKDQTTAAAVGRLFPVAPDAEALGRLSEEEIARLIFPVGFYRAKARHLKALPGVLRERFGGRVPNTVEALTELPGVGRKTANLVVALGFGLPAICVDTHVHRINNRLGIVRTKTPLETEMALRKCLPERLWIAWNSIFVSFGQTRCKPIGPRCEGCPVARFCSVAAAGKARKGAKA